jgi:hypothetical protein
LATAFLATEFSATPFSASAFVATEFNLTRFSHAVSLTGFSYGVPTDFPRRDVLTNVRAEELHGRSGELAMRECARALWKNTGTRASSENPWNAVSGTPWRNPQ